MVEDAVLRRACALVARHGLHDEPFNLPVPIRQVAKDEGWHLRFASDMHPIIAFAVMYGGVKLMTVSESATARVQRHGIAHEIAHDLCQHEAPMSLYLPRSQRKMWPKWVIEKQEEEANLVASLLLIPQAVIDSPFDDEWVACTCGVPMLTVKLRRTIEWGESRPRQGGTGRLRLLAGCLAAALPTMAMLPV